MDNAKVLENGLAKAVEKIEDTIINSLMDTAGRLLHAAFINRTYAGFTGNTQTSYMAGIYLRGRLVAIVEQKDSTAPTRRMKVKKGQWVYLVDPYEGDSRSVYGGAVIVENHGKTLSRKFLESYKANRKGIVMVITTGTEYSELLEAVTGLDVLTKTYADAHAIINRNWKKIDEIK